MYRRSFRRKPLLLAALLVMFGSLLSFAQADEVNVYSARKEALTQDVLPPYLAVEGPGEGTEPRTP